MITESDWIRVFEYRCRSKRGERLTDAEMDLCKAALKANKKRYTAMDKDVFDATAPFGSVKR